MAGLLHRFGVLNLQTDEGEIDRVEEIFCEVSMPEMKDDLATQPVRRRLPDERKAIGLNRYAVGATQLPALRRGEAASLQPKLTTIPS